jgi:hypothetical protein
MILAAVDGRAAGARRDARLAQDRHGLALLEGGFERAQLGVYLGERAELGDHERVVALPESMQVEHQPAEVPIGELAGFPQESRAAAHAPARAEAG